MNEFFDQSKIPQNFVWDSATKLGLYAGVEFFLHNIKEPFSLSWAVDLLKKHCFIYNPEPTEHIKRLFAHSEMLGKIDLPDPLYYPASYLFQNKKFVVYPSQEERDEGILVIGDALRPYHMPTLDIPELSFYDYQGNAINTFHWSCSEVQLNQWYLNPVEDVQNLFSLDILDFAELSPSKQDHYDIPVLELSAFYQKNNFQLGDGVEFTVVDYEKGIFSAQLLKAVPKMHYKFCSIEFQNTIELDIVNKIKRTGVHPMVYQALLDVYARMLHRGDASSRFSPLAWSRLLLRSKRFKIFTFHSERVLYRGKLNKWRQLEMVQELYWPLKKSENLDDMLETSNCALNSNVLRAYVLRAIHDGKTRQSFFDDIFHRFFIDQFSEEDEQLFHHFFEDFWNECYNQFFKTGRSYTYKPAQSICQERALSLFEKIIEYFEHYRLFREDFSFESLQYMHNLRLNCDLAIKKLHDPDLSIAEVREVGVLLQNLTLGLSNIKNAF